VWRDRIKGSAPSTWGSYKEVRDTRNRPFPQVTGGDVFDSGRRNEVFSDARKRRKPRKEKGRNAGPVLVVGNTGTVLEEGGGSVTSAQRARAQMDKEGGHRKGLEGGIKSYLNFGQGWLHQGGACRAWEGGGGSIKPIP